MPEKPEKGDIIPPLNTKVSPDSQNIKAESQGFKEDLAIAEWLINSKSYAEGNNGLIRTINTANIPPFLIDGNSEPISPDNAVVKLLKIYEPAQGQKEFERQTKASELLVGRDTAHYAQTPRAFLHRTIHISDPVLIFRLKEKQFPVGRLPEIKINPNVAESLGMDKKKKYNWDTVTEKEVKIFWENGYLRDLQSEMFFILMDFIPGKDLGRIIYEQIALLDADVKDHLQRLNLTPDAASFVDLQKAVAQKFFYRTQNKYKHHQIGEEELLIKRENYKQIIKFLKGKFIMPKYWLDKIEKTVKLWNSQGFFHQDLHERNIIIDPNDDVYIIDYGEAQISNQSPASSTDLNVVFSYQYLTQNKEEDRQQEKSELFNNLKTFYHKLLADKSWRDIEQQITSAADDERAQLSIIKFVAQRRPSERDNAEILSYLLLMKTRLDKAELEGKSKNIIIAEIAKMIKRQDIKNRVINLWQFTDDLF